VRNLLRGLWLLPLALALASCGGGSSESGGGAAGATPYTGPWFLTATVNVNIEGATSSIRENSEIVVGASGNAVVAKTDSDCSLSIVVNGDVMTYETTCVFTAASGDASVPCVLTLRSRAKIRGAPGNGQLSGSFGPETEVCRGAAVSYAGNLIGNQRGPAESDAVEATDETDTDTES